MDESSKEIQEADWQQVAAALDRALRRSDLSLAEAEALFAAAPEEPLEKRVVEALVQEVTHRSQPHPIVVVQDDSMVFRVELSQGQLEISVYREWKPMMVLVPLQAFSVDIESHSVDSHTVDTRRIQYPRALDEPAPVGSALIAGPSPDEEAHRQFANWQWTTEAAQVSPGPVSGTAESVEVGAFMEPSTEQPPVDGDRKPNPK